MAYALTKNWLLLTCASLLLAVSSSVFAETSQALSDPHNGSVFRLNVSPNGYPPYLINNGNDNSGIIWDVTKAIASRIGYQIEARKIPRKRVDQMILDGHIDGTTRAIEWTSRADEFLFTDPVVDIEEVVFFPKESDLTYEDVEDLFSLRLVTHLGYKYPVLRPHFESGEIKRFDVSRDEDLFTFVLKGEQFHAAIADRLVGQWILRNNNMQDEFRHSTTTLSRYEFRLMVRPDLKPFVEGFNRELARMRQSGELDAILSRYR